MAKHTKPPLAPRTLARARNLRQPQTSAERKLWRRLRDRQLAGLKFRRQHPIDRFIVDFCCPESRLIIEIDGDSHADSEAHDAARTACLSGHGYRVLRFYNEDVHHRLDAVLEAILAECDAGRTLTPRPSTAGNGE